MCLSCVLPWSNWSSRLTCDAGPSLQNIQDVIKLGTSLTLNGALRLDPALMFIDRHPWSSLNARNGCAYLWNRTKRGNESCQRCQLQSCRCPAKDIGFWRKGSSRFSILKLGTKVRTSLTFSHSQRPCTDATGGLQTGRRAEDFMCHH